MKKKSTPTKRKSVSVAGTKTRKISGSRYTKVTCSKRKTDAKKKAENLRKNGSKARVIKEGSTYCVFKGPRRKVKKKK